MTIAPPDQSSYNAVLNQAGFLPYLVDLRGVPAGPASVWANGPSIFLEYGLGGQNLSVTGPLKQWFDLLVFIRQSTPSRPIG